MRILVVGAGAIGGYFGARLLQAASDVTFLVRPARAAQLREGLRVRSSLGNIDLPAPPLVTAPQLKPGFDLILLSCKAYDLGGAIDSFTPALDANCTILPLLNGMGHLQTLRDRCGRAALLGGSCIISSTLEPDGTIEHFGSSHLMTFGELNGERSARAEVIAAEFAKSSFDSRLSQSIVQDMWDKWVIIAATAAATCLMRAAVGDILKAGGEGFLMGMLQETAGIAAANGHPFTPAMNTRARAMLTQRDSTMMASMLRDMERGGRIEADHIVGDLLKSAAAATSAAPAARLQSAYLHLKAYEQRRQREGKGEDNRLRPVSSG
jgi:2-dehydropantoate 2-reductase